MDILKQHPVTSSENHPSLHSKFLNKSNKLAATRENRGKAIVNSSCTLLMIKKLLLGANVDENVIRRKEIDSTMALFLYTCKNIYKPYQTNLGTSSNTSRANQAHPSFHSNYKIFFNTLRINRGIGYDNQRAVNVVGARENVGTQVDDDDDDVANEHDLLASKLKCEIDDNKNRNKFLESSNKTLVDKLKGEIEDFKNKNKSLESSYNHFKEANNELSKTNQLMLKDLKKFQDELEKRHDVNYMSKVELKWKAQLQDKDIAISELKKLIEKMKGKSVETKFEKPSVIRHPNAFKSQRSSVLGVIPTTNVSRPRIQPVVLQVSGDICLSPSTWEVELRRRSLHEESDSFQSATRKANVPKRAPSEDNIVEVNIGILAVPGAAEEGTWPGSYWNNQIGALLGTVLLRLQKWVLLCGHRHNTVSLLLGLHYWFLSLFEGEGKPLGGSEVEGPILVLTVPQLGLFSLYFQLCYGTKLFSVTQFREWYSPLYSSSYRLFDSSFSTLRPSSWNPKGGLIVSFTGFYQCLWPVGHNYPSVEPTFNTF
ncbi:hypothetical protein Tco_1311955 [Tanacetum coccineum]